MHCVLIHNDNQSSKSKERGGEPEGERGGERGGEPEGERGGEPEGERVV